MTRWPFVLTVLSAAACFSSADFDVTQPGPGAKDGASAGESGTGNGGAATPATGAGPGAGAAPGKGGGPGAGAGPGKGGGPGGGAALSFGGMGAGGAGQTGQGGDAGTSAVGVGGSSAQSGSGGTSGGTPLSCTQTNQAVGCCDATTLYYCGTGGLATPKTCAQGCGWNPMKAYYDCGFTGADPSGTAPIACGVIPSSCSQTNGLAGCCGPKKGDSAVHVWHCFFQQPQEYGMCLDGCGWSATKKAYVCCTNGAVDCDTNGTPAYPKWCAP